jgi:hypothetical protein
MRTFPRLVILLLAVALFGTTFLPWIGQLTSREVAFGSLVSPGSEAPDRWVASMAVSITAAALLMLLGAIVNSRVLIVIGGLAAVGFPAAWLLVAMLGGDVVMTSVGAGLYGALAIGLVALVLSAAAVDVRAPSVR